MEPGSMEEASATVEVQVRAPKGSKGAEDVEKGQDNAERGQAAPIEPPREDLPPANSPLEVSFADMLFKHADRWDLTLLGLGVAGSVLSGVLIPVFTILFGNLLNNFWGVDVEAQVNRMCLFIFFIAIASFVGAALEVGCLKQYAARQAHCVRGLFLRAYLRQDIAFVDAAGGPGRVMQGLNDDADAYQAALGDKLGNFIHSLACFISAIVIAFWRGWDIALVMLSSIPALALVSAAAAVYQGRLQAHASAAYGGAASITQQALSNVRTVAGYGLEERTVQAYQKALTTPAKVGVWQGLVAGLTLGSAHFTYYGAYGLAVWYGSGRVADGDTTPGYVVNVLLSAVLAGFGLGQAIPFIPAFQRGRAAAADLFAIIARRPAIDLDGPGETLSRDDLQGNLELRDVVFAYPATPDRPVLRGFNLSVSAGRSVALVGESGCGKSTVIALIQRFHDPQGGQVLLDGRDVRDLQLRWMREQMGLVTQEPVLFSGSIRDNIAIGAPDASERQIVEAASAANSYGFILKLPLGLDTLVGEQGSALSGGQKQRIAIARALLRNPKVLLLDEATSALDAASEKAVQDAVDALVESQECTVVLIAHRLSTVKGADTIAVVKDGAVVEQGCHEVLVEKENGLYRNLVARQQVDGPEEGGGEGDDGVHAAPQPPRPSLFRWLRDSILHRGTVRLSVIPESVRRKLGASAGDDPAAEAEGAENREGADKRVGLSRMAALQTRREWRMGALAFACSAMAGLQMPIFALSIASVTASMFSFDPDGVRWGGSKWGLVLTGVAVGCLLFEAIQGWSLAIMGQNLACRVRTLMLRAVLKQDIGWFDQEENSSSAIASRMSNDAAAVRGACGDSLGLLVQNLSCLIAAYAIGFTSSWSVTLVASAVLPLMVAGQAVQAAVAFKRSKKDDDPLAGANQLATEATASIRTVAAFSLQEEIASRYTRAAHAGGTRAASAQGGLAYGLSMLVLYSAFSLGFWFGGREVLAGRISFRDLLRAFLAIFYCAFGIAHAQAAFPEVGSAGAALPRVFGIIDRPSPIDPSSAEGATFEQVEGAVEFRDVTFAYPARPGRLVFKHLSLEVPAGTSCALVGESGHGKSTLIALLERFYDPTEGQVLLDGVDLRSLSVRWLRAQLGLVSQDCVLFAGSVADNIRIGAPGAPLEQVQAAAKTANAFNFVAHLPAGFATRVGEGGLQLSGGQKQRIAIARALLRNPKILLLDEATSALDAESEAAVLDGLATAMVGRTTLLVAHRLTTVCCATKIAVIHRGRVLEQGSHEELAAQRGYYSCLLEAAAA